MRGWMDSPGHRANILRDTYTHLGVGIALQMDKLYITQAFCTPIAMMIDAMKVSYKAQNVYALRFRYMSPLASKRLCCLLRLPNPRKYVRLNLLQYAVGCKPLAIKWITKDQFEITLSFNAVAGTYALEFGFDNKFFKNDITINVE